MGGGGSSRWHSLARGGEGRDGKAGTRGQPTRAAPIQFGGKVGCSGWKNPALPWSVARPCCSYAHTVTRLRARPPTGELRVRREAMTHTCHAMPMPARAFTWDEQVVGSGLGECSPARSWDYSSLYLSVASGGDDTTCVKVRTRGRRATRHMLHDRLKTVRHLSLGQACACLRTWVDVCSRLLQGGESPQRFALSPPFMSVGTHYGRTPSCSPKICMPDVQVYN